MPHPDSRPSGATLDVPDTAPFPLARTVAMPEEFGCATGAISFHLTDLVLRATSVVRSGDHETLCDLNLMGRHHITAVPDPVCEVDHGGNLDFLPTQALQPTDGGADPAETYTPDPRAPQWADAARNERKRLEKMANGKKMLAEYDKHNEIYDELFRQVSLIEQWRGNTTRAMCADTHLSVKDNTVINGKTYLNEKENVQQPYNAHAFQRQMMVTAQLSRLRKKKPSGEQQKYHDAALAILDFRGKVEGTGNGSDKVAKMTREEVYTAVTTPPPNAVNLPPPTLADLAQYDEEEPGEGGAATCAAPGPYTLTEEERALVRQVHLEAARREAAHPDGTGHVLFTGAATARIPGVRLVPQPGAAPRAVTATASGTVVLGSGISLEAKGTFTSKAATFRLAAKNGTSLTALLSAAGVPMNGGCPELRMKTLAAEVTVPRGPFTFDAQVDGQGKLSLGSAQAHLTQGALRLTRPEAKGNPAPPVGGKLTVVAQVKPKSGEGNSAGVPQFSATWKLPGTFRLAGSVPKLGLPSLVSGLAGPGALTWPDELPTIEIAQASLALTIAPGSGTGGRTGSGTGGGTGGTNGKGGVYDLRAGGTVSIAGTELVRVVCLARKNGTKTVVAAALWKPGWTFSLGDLPGCDPMLKQVLGALVFRETGLLIATGPGAQLEWDGDQPPKNLPSKTTAGVTFFTQAGFGQVLQPVLKAIGVTDLHGIPLSATLAKSLVDTTISLRLGKAPAIGVESFHLDVKPKLRQFALRAEMRLSFRDLTGSLVHLDLVAGGALGLSGDLLVAFVIRAATGNVNDRRMDQLIGLIGGADLVKQEPGKPPEKAPAWKDALGIKGLTIEHFWGQIGYVAKSPGLTVGLGGQVRLAARGGGQVLLRLATSVSIEGPVVKPNAYEFHLEAGGHGDKGVTLAALLGQFTQQNLDNVPLLRDLELRKLMMAVVTVPWENPATKQMWDPGLWVGGDLVVFGYHAVFGVRLSKEGITAFGSIDKPIILVRDVVEFTSAGQDKQGKWTGPRAAVDTTKITSSGGPHKPYLFLDARCTLLGMTSSIKAEADRTGTLHFRWEATQFKVFSEKVICRLDKGAFTGKVGGEPAVRLKITSPVKIAGHTVLPTMDIACHPRGRRHDHHQPGLPLPYGRHAGPRPAEDPGRLRPQWPARLEPPPRRDHQILHPVPQGSPRLAVQERGDLGEARRREGHPDH